MRGLLAFVPWDDSLLVTTRTHLDGHDARNDRAVDADPSTPLHVAEVSLRVVEKLRHHEVSPRVHLIRNRRAKTGTEPRSTKHQHTEIQHTSSTRGVQWRKKVTSTRVYFSIVSLWPCTLSVNPFKLVPDAKTKRRSSVKYEPRPQRAVPGGIV